MRADGENEPSQTDRHFPALQAEQGHEVSSPVDQRDQPMSFLDQPSFSCPEWSCWATNTR